MFPQLTAVQIARLEAHGTHSQTHEGEILAEPGDRNRPMLVILAGSIEVVQTGMNAEVLVVVHTAGSFTGEMSTLQGIGSLVRLRVRESGRGAGHRRGSAAHDHSDRRRAQRAVHASLHLEARRADRSPGGRRHSARFESFGGNPAPAAIPDSEFVSVRQRRREHRAGRAGAVGALSRQGRRYSRGAVPWRSGTQESQQRRSGGLPRDESADRR